MDQDTAKKKRTLFIGLFYGKKERRNNNATLDKEFKIIEQHLYKYITNNQNDILLLVTLMQKLEMENKVYPLVTPQ